MTRTAGTTGAHPEYIRVPVNPQGDALLAQTMRERDTAAEQVDALNAATIDLEARLARAREALVDVKLQRGGSDLRGLYVTSERAMLRLISALDPDASASRRDEELGRAALAGFRKGFNAAPAPLCGPDYPGDWDPGGPDYSAADAPDEVYYDGLTGATAPGRLVGDGEGTAARDAPAPDDPCARCKAEPVCDKRVLCPMRDGVLAAPDGPAPDDLGARLVRLGAYVAPSTTGRVADAWYAGRSGIGDGGDYGEAYYGPTPDAAVAALERALAGGGG